MHIRYHYIAFVYGFVSFLLTIFVLYKWWFIFDLSYLYSNVIHYYSISVYLYSMAYICIGYFTFVFQLHSVYFNRLSFDVSDGRCGIIVSIPDHCLPFYLTGLFYFVLLFLLIILPTTTTGTVFTNFTYTSTDNTVRHFHWCCLYTFH